MKLEPRGLRLHVMTFEEFTASIESDRSPSENLPPALAALWQAKKGDWDLAHAIVQDDDSKNGAWVHAYLHREEGDEGNAGYWYARAGKLRSTVSLEEEWEQIVRALLEAVK